MMPQQGMFSQMNPQILQMLMAQQGQNQGQPQGFVNPGQGLNNNGVPSLPQFSGGGAGGMPQGGMMPPSLPQGATTTPNGGTAGQMGGMFQNPMMMAMLAQKMGGSPQQLPPGASGAAGGLFTSSPLSSPENTGALQTLFANGGNNPYGSAPQSGMFQNWLHSLFAGNP